MKISFWDILSILALLGVVLLVILFSTIFINPYSAFNPFKPQTQPALLVMPTKPTGTNTPFVFPPTWTATFASGMPSTTTLGPRSSSTPILTSTRYVLSSFTPSPTPTVTPTQTATPTVTRTVTNTPTATRYPTYTPLPTYTRPATVTPTATTTPASYPAH